MNDRYDVRAKLTQAQEEINVILRTLHEETGMVIECSEPCYPVYSGTSFFSVEPPPPVQKYITLTARLEVRP